jgi:hypothetical protein
VATQTRVELFVEDERDTSISCSTKTSVTGYKRFKNEINEQVVHGGRI